MDDNIKVPPEWIKLRELVFQAVDIDSIEDHRSDKQKIQRNIFDIARQQSSQNNVYLSSNEDMSILVDMITDEITGYGPLNSLMEDDSINDILINSPYNIYIERRGILEKSDKFFINNRQLLDIARRLVNRFGRNIDDSHPLADVRMFDGSRLNVVIPPVAIDGVSMSIRKFGKDEKTLESLVKFGSLSREMANFLVIVARCKMNVIISGGTGSGKTILLNSLSQFIDHSERIVTLEDAAELRLQQDHVVRLETRTGSDEGRGKVSMRDLLINALRMRPDRIIVGECRGEETFEMLQAMNTGHSGSMSTLHANTPRDALGRLESMVMMAQSELPLMAIRRYIATSVNFIVQTSRLPDRQRKITHISEVMGMEGDMVVMHDVFIYKIDDERESETGKISGKFYCHGLTKRSALYEKAIYYSLYNTLQRIIDDATSEV